MRAFARILLLFGPVLSLPVAVGLWAQAYLSDDLYVLAVVGAAVLLEVLLVRKRGLLREVAVFLLSGLWVMWMWLALTQETYDWISPPAWRQPGAGEWMVIIMAVLVYLTFFEIAQAGPAGRKRPLEVARTIS